MEEESSLDIPVSSVYNGAVTTYNTEFELTGRGFSKMGIRRGKQFHGVDSKKLFHVVIAPTSAKLR